MRRQTVHFSSQNDSTAISIDSIGMGTPAKKEWSDEDKKF
jgi:hypothetical protein